MQQTISYYLPPIRSIVVGTILILMGLGITFSAIDTNSSISNNLQLMFLDFTGVFDFIGSFILLLFKIGFIAGGYLYIKYADGVERARIDDEGLYFREIPKGAGLQKVGIDVGPLSFAPYSAIKDITYQKSFWLGSQIYLTLASDKMRLVALGVLKQHEKQEIVQLVKTRISKP